MGALDILEKTTQDDGKLSPDEIIANHIQNNGLDTTQKDSIAEIRATIRQNKNAHLIHINDCLFLLKIDDGEGLIYIFNGGGKIQYIKALKTFVSQCKKAGLKKLKMYISDKNASSQIATLAGVSNVSYEDKPNRQTDPYLMTMEL